ncbi:MAG: hypothetical protein ACI8Y4_002919 [Candidatus Poriferisodalaceae bacterium]|jgi:uncharacterized protein (DUF58 family)
MLTRHGWLLLASGAVVTLAGRVLAIFELFIAGTAAIGLVVLAAIWVGLTRLRVSVTRTVRPVRVHARTPARVDLIVANLGRATPIMRLRDPVQGTRGADIAVGPLLRKEQARASYVVPTEHRGRVDVGPMTIDVNDPFGLAAIKIAATGKATLIVYPHIDHIKPVPFTSGRDPHGGAHDARSLGRIGEEFYALRQYTVGDDLRRVHWASTARRGEIMVRQDELPWQGRVTVLLDTRATAHTPETFEPAVSAAASIISACARRRDLVRLVTTHGGDSDFATGHGHVDSLLEYLALVEPTNRGTFQAALASVQRGESGGAVIAVMGHPRAADSDAVARLAGAAGHLALVRFGLDERGGASETPANLSLVDVSPGQDFRKVWERSFGAPTGATPPSSSPAGAPTAGAR